MNCKLIPNWPEKSVANGGVANVMWPSLTTSVLVVSLALNCLLNWLQPMRIQRFLLTTFILGSLFAVSLFSVSMFSHAVHASTLGDDGLHKQDWFALTFKDIEEDWREANEQGKRLVLVFEQRGCIYCEKTHATVLSDPEIVSYLKEHFVIVQYNLFGDEEVTDLDGEVLAEKTAGEKWGVMFTPTWLFLPDNVTTGQSVKDVAVGQMPGAFGKGTFLDLFTWVNEEGYDGDETFQRYHARRDRERHD